MTTARGNARTTARTALVATVSATLAGALAVTVDGEVRAQPQPQPQQPAKRAASAVPGFLAAKDLPPVEGTPWYAGKVTRGMPEFPVLCLEDVLPADGATWHRTFRTDLDAEALQVTVVMPSARAAERLAAAVDKVVADWLRANPGSTAAWDDYGRLPVEDGAHAYGTYFAPPEAGMSVNLHGVGRDGNTVTFVDWGCLGALKDAPVSAFEQTTTTAVDKLR
ncbi:hypothetical protein QCN29_00305 [Streptomyces sp. HNM0663]|uniref:Uncharacterized protein n=1 Tax=Streptomyces chengmaiensis TaxID=3040919 RepID=A0ABT6HG52_9ACTN|nr:hypothetical protein [Streptomyces chengmaiensis]MDH2387250.1 hypothetical protein [Streptomyces chengmaiensis]